MPWTHLLAVAALAQTGPPVIHSRFESVAPLPTSPPVMIDSFHTGLGLAQETCKGLGLQGRVLWIDATANLYRTASAEKCRDLVAKIKDAGFNTIVLDVKPIAGLTLYPSALAPRLTSWRGGPELSPDFDAVDAMVKEAKANGLTIFASLNAFSEGHNMFRLGPGYDKPQWQTVLYEPVPTVIAPNNAAYSISMPFNQLPDAPGSMGWITSPSKVPAPAEGNFAVTLDTKGVVVDGFEGGGAAKGVPTIPERGSLLVGSGGAAIFLRSVALPGTKLNIKTVANFVKSGERPLRQIPLCMNPNNPELQDHELDILREVVSKYPVDGVLYDDRFRYAGLDADFSEVTRALFEKSVGKKVVWPDDVFTYTIQPNMTRGIQPGPLYDTWMAFRAQQLKAFFYRARLSIKAIRPTCQLGLYAGSWYGEYPALGSNWASSEFDAGFWFLTPEYRRAGLANILDLFIAGCYYYTPTIYQAMSEGLSAGQTVEASATLVNRAMRDQTWTYAGIDVSGFKGNTEALRNCLQAACASSQGVMVFDLSHDVESMFPFFKEAFGPPRKAPHERPDALERVRILRAKLDKMNVKEPPVVILGGTTGIGQ